MKICLILCATLWLSACQTINKITSTKQPNPISFTLNQVKGPLFITHTFKRLWAQTHPKSGLTLSAENNTPIYAPAQPGSSFAGPLVGYNTTAPQAEPYTFDITFTTNNTNLAKKNQHLALDNLIIEADVKITTPTGVRRHKLRRYVPYARRTAHFLNHQRKNHATNQAIEHLTKQLSRILNARH
jgi:hypothetical protein